MSIIKTTYFLPEDNWEFNMSLNGEKYFRALWDFDQELRAIAKHGDDEAEADYAEEFRDKLWEIMERCGINLHDEF